MRGRLLFVSGALGAAGVVAFFLMRSGPPPAPPVAPDPPASEPAAAPARRIVVPAVVAEGTTGTIRGRCSLARPVVRWRVPAPKCRNNATILTESVDANDEGDLGGCVVSLVVPDDRRASSEGAPDATFRLSETLDGFKPHVAAARAHVQLEVANLTKCDFCVHGFRESLKDTQFNFASPPGALLDDAESAYLTSPGTYLIRDDCHPGCSATLHVFDHPWFDVTSAEARPRRAAGEYVLSDVPPGDWDVVCRHEPMLRRTLRQEGRVVAYSYADLWASPPARAHVLAGRETTVDFTVPVPAEIPAPPDVYTPDR